MSLAGWSRGVNGTIGTSGLTPRTKVVKCSDDHTFRARTATATVCRSRWAVQIQAALRSLWCSIVRDCGESFGLCSLLFALRVEGTCNTRVAMSLRAFTLRIEYAECGTVCGIIDCTGCRRVVGGKPLLVDSIYVKPPASSGSSFVS